ncbi:MAG: hypothetical protein ACI8TQ_000334 [Planctomycetota bacterium]|jgi:hypothetical protein
MKLLHELSVLTTAITLSLCSVSQADATTALQQSNQAEILLEDPSWYQITEEHFKVKVIDQADVLRIVFTEPEFYAGHFLFVQAYDIQLDQHLMLPTGVNMFEPGEEVYYELGRAQLERLDSVAFKLFSSSLLDPRNNPANLAKPIFVDAVVHNPSSTWAAPIVTPIEEIVEAHFGASAPSSSAPPTTAPLGPKLKEVGITPNIMGYFITYCCPQISLDEDGDPTGPFLDEKGRATGCNVQVLGAGGGAPITLKLIPGGCASISALTTMSSSGSYWQKTKN